MEGQVLSKVQYVDVDFRYVMFFAFKVKLS